MNHWREELAQSLPCYHHDCTAVSVAAHLPGMRPIWTCRDTLWNETLLSLSFPASSGLKWAWQRGSSVTIANHWELSEHFCQPSAPWSSSQSKWNGWNQMWSRLRKDRRYLASLLRKEIKSWGNSFSRFSKVQALRAGITFYMIPSGDIRLKRHTVLGEGRMGFEQLTKMGRKWNTIWYLWITKNLCNTKVNEVVLESLPSDLSIS